MVYTTTALEDWVTRRYKRYSIKKASDIDIRRLAYIYDIYIHYKPMPARYDIFGKYRAIVLDSRCNPLEQREQFYHELCHILIHDGHQTMMPEAFRELQEWDANHFTMYAALPFYMVRKYDFESPYIIYDLSHDFKVTEELCKERMAHIKRNLMANTRLVSYHK